MAQLPSIEELAQNVATRAKEILKEENIEFKTADEAYLAGYEQGRADEQLASIEDAKMRAKETIMAIDKARADERARIFEIIEERLNDDTTVMFDLPVEEKLGDDVDMDNFLMLAEEIVQQYKSLIFSKLREAKEQSNEFM